MDIGQNKKEYDTQPTLKQKVVFEKTLENNGNVGEAMREAGYSEASSQNPQLVTKSKGWQQLVEEFLPNDVLAEKHRQLLNKTDEKGSLDVNAVAKGLDMAYKLKGSYARKGVDVTSNNNKITAINYIVPREC